MRKCLICGKSYTNLGSHVKQRHSMTQKDYYDKYLKKPDEGICVVCGKHTSYDRWRYRTCCSQACSVKNPKRQEKIAATNLKRYGVTNVYQRPITRQKAQKNSHTPEAIEKQMQTKANTYGCRSFFELPEVQEKAKVNLRKSVPRRVQSFLNMLDEFEKENDCTRTTKLIRQYGQGWLKIKSSLTIFHKGQYSFVANEDIERIANYKSSWGSFLEKEVADFVESYAGIVRNDRKLLNGLELDIYVPEHSLAIEVNGDYWHSAEHKDKDYHLNKTIQCEKLGVRLIHIFESDWLEKNDICKSIILSAMNIYERRISAIEVKEICLEDAETFFANNYLTKFLPGYCLGAFYKDELVQVAVIDKGKYMLCDKLNTYVDGLQLPYTLVVDRAVYMSDLPRIDSTQPELDERGFYDCGKSLHCRPIC